MDAIGMLMWAYMVTRFLQIPAEYTGDSEHVRKWLRITSGIGIAVATILLLALLAGVSGALRALRQY